MWPLLTKNRSSLKTLSILTTKFLYCQKSVNNDFKFYIKISYFTAIRITWALQNVRCYKLPYMHLIVIIGLPVMVFLSGNCEIYTPTHIHTLSRHHSYAGKLENDGYMLLLMDFRQFAYFELEAWVWSF